MPIYAHRCSLCGYRRDVFARVADRETPQECQCGATMDRVITAAHVAPDYAGYSCPRTGQWIEGRRAHAENLARTGCRLLESGETAQYSKRREAEDDAFFESIAESAAKTVANMPPEKQEKLANELSHGVDVAFTRESPGT